MIEAHAEHRVAGLHHGEVCAEVGLRARMGLHVGELRTVELAGAVAGKVLHDVDLLAAAVVALAGIALGVLVGEHATDRLHDGAGGKVLRRDELDGAALTVELGAQGAEHLGVGLGKIFESHDARFLSRVSGCLNLNGKPRFGSTRRAPKRANATGEATPSREP